MSQDQTEPLEDLVARCVAAFERGCPDEVDVVCEEHPDHAAAIRRQLQRLRDGGLLEAANLDDLPSFGDYRVLRRLGSGGMGSVWLAEQESPVQRLVALKVMLPRMGSAELLTRFELERQALARMNHPNVAQLYDAGTTPDGRPFFAMEHVDGSPIVGWADRAGLSTAERTRLMLPVLEGVQHAHQRGVIHRDLKPGNILVAEVDGVPVPKVIDFGIAKAMDGGPETAAAGLTVAGSFLGTPEYMSPEQMRGTDTGADTRADVFALGVTLYELLTGTLPVEGARLRRAGPLEMLRIRLEERPPSPSSRITVATRDDATTITARKRSTTPAALRKQLRGEIDWIVLKAIDQDRDRRYATVKEFADDLRNHLDGKPVSAGPPSVWYHFRKLVARHRAASLAAAVALVALVGGLVAVTSYADRADRSRENAIHRLGQAMGAVDELLTNVAATRLAHVPQMEAVRRDILRSAVVVLNRLVDEETEEPRVHEELTRARIRLGRIHLQLGEVPAATQHLATAIGELDALIPLLADAGNATVLRARAAAELAKTAPDNAERIAGTAAAIELLRSPVAVAAKDSGARTEYLGDAIHNLAGYRADSDPAAAVELLGESIALHSSLVAGAPLETDPRVAIKVVVSKAEMGSELYRLGRQDEAIDTLQEAIAEADRLVDGLPHRVDVRLMAAGTCGRLAAILNHAQESERAGPYARQAYEALTELSRDYPAIVDFRYRVAYAAQTLAAIEARSGNVEAARAVLAASIRILDELEAAEFDGQPAPIPHRVKLLGALETAISIELQLPADQADLDGAEQHLERGLRIATELQASLSDSADAAMLLLVLRSRAAILHKERGRFEQALEQCELVERDARAVLERYPDHVELGAQVHDALINAASYHLRLGDPDAASAAYARAAALLDGYLERRPAGNAIAARIGLGMTVRGDSLVEAGHYAACLALLGQVDRIARSGSASAFVEAAEIVARGAERLGSDTRVPVAERERLTRESIALVVTLLERGVTAGLEAPERILERKPFGALRDHEAIRALRARWAAR